MGGCLHSRVAIEMVDSHRASSVDHLPIGGVAAVVVGDGGVLKALFAKHQPRVNGAHIAVGVGGDDVDFVAARGSAAQ